MEWIERPRRSLYLQRVALLAVCALLLFVPLGIQMLRLTVTQHDTLRDEAESKLVVERLTPTVRGRILDRNGNVLAQDVATYDIAVDYSLITGTWATRRAASHARWDHRGDWPKLSRTQRQQLIEQYLPEFRSKLDLMWLELARRGRVSPETVLQRRARIWQDVEQLADHIAQRRLEQMLAMNVGKETFEELTIEDAAMTIREQTVAHTVLPAVADEVAFDFMRFLDERELGKSERDLRDDPFAGVRVIDSTRREYPFETMTVPIDMSAMPATLRRDERVWVKVQGVDTHIIGWMRDQHFKEDVQHRSEWTETISDEQRERVMASGRDRGRYLLGDAVGHVGLEGASEFNLRGLRGIRRRQLDTGTVTEIAADSGNDVVLTLDIDLQARVQALFDESVGLAVSQPWHTNPYQEPGARLNGAVVVLDVRTSDVLAMVSVPSFTRERFQQHASEMLADEENTPTINRAIAKRYASGSIVKPLMYCGAVRRGVLGRDERIECTGMFYADKPTLYRCWIYKMFGITHSDQLGHGPNGAEAIMASCNIFFYEVGRRLGVDGINDLYRRLGVGSDALGPDFGLLAWPGTASARTLQEAILMGIGQGPIDWTPMHAADAYATLGRGGVRIVPRLRSNAPVQADDLGFDPRTVETALHGLRLGVQRREGTTNHIRYIDEQGQRHDEPIFNAPGVTVWVKSGTADAGKLVSENDLDGDGQPDVIHRDHSWVVCLVGPEGGEPTHAVAVVVDFGGSGGKVAGPIANQIIHQLQALGYLPGGQADETTANARTVGGGMKRLIEDIVGQRLMLINFAWLSVLAALALGLIGVYAIDIAVHVEPGTTAGALNLSGESAKQLVFLGVGVLAAALVAVPHYRWVRYLAWPMMWVTLGLLVFLLVPFVPASLVTPRNGARAWIDLGPIDFQPSEVAKIAFVLALAEYLRFRKSQATVVGLLIPAVICGVPVMLIILQPDLGTASLFVPALFAMLVAAGARLKHLIVIVAVAMLAGPLAYPLLKPHQKARIEGMIAMISGSHEGADDINYQSITAMTLAGAGGVDGYSDRKARALMEYNHLPERHNDMVLAVILNRFGLLGGFVLMMLYAVWLAGAMLTAAVCKDPFGRLVVIGCAAILMVQMAINMGMTMGLLPIIGITLPFVSYGGSSMLSVWLMTGLIVSVALRPEPRLMQPAYEFGTRTHG